MNVEGGKIFLKKEYKFMDRVVIYCRNLKLDFVLKKFIIYYVECNMF